MRDHTAILIGRRSRVLNLQLINIRADIDFVVKDVLSIRAGHDTPVGLRVLVRRLFARRERGQLALDRVMVDVVLAKRFNRHLGIGTGPRLSVAILRQCFLVKRGRNLQ